MAIPLSLLDGYVKDIGKSFLIFGIIIGPTLYKTYYLKENMFSRQQTDPLSKEDSYAKLLV